jgi:protein-disulfide isomerase
MIGVSYQNKMRLFLTVLFCGLMATIQTVTAPNARAQAASDSINKLSAPFNPENFPPPQVQHTPSGQMYMIPTAEPEKTFSGSIEVGVSATTGDTNNAKFREYQDPRNGPAINNFDFSVEH